MEGYVEWAAMGLIAGLSVHCLLSGKELVPLPENTAYGALINYITKAEHKIFQPMSVNFGIFLSLAQKIPKKDRGRHYAKRALSSLETAVSFVDVLRNTDPRGISDLELFTHMALSCNAIGGGHPSDEKAVSSVRHARQPCGCKRLQ